MFLLLRPQKQNCTRSVRNSCTRTKEERLESTYYEKAISRGKTWAKRRFPIIQSEKNKQRMPAESSIYWSSVDSRKSTSGSSGSDAGSRHYVDPWDLENYAYLRRHSVADVPRRTRRPPTNERSSRDTRAFSEYWYALPSLRESEYDGSPYAQELYRRPIKPTNNGFYYQQAIYEDEGMDYTAPFPVYTPGLFEISRYPPQEERCLPYAIHTDKDRYIAEAICPPHIGHLNTYGHLKIDYTNSWNSLNRRIRK